MKGTTWNSGIKKGKCVVVPLFMTNCEVPTGIPVGILWYIRDSLLGFGRGDTQTNVGQRVCACDRVRLSRRPRSLVSGTPANTNDGHSRSRKYAPKCLTFIH
jgi:hypothetical protein